MFKKSFFLLGFLLLTDFASASADYSEMYRSFQSLSPVSIQDHAVTLIGRECRVELRFYGSPKSGSPWVRVEDCSGKGDGTCARGAYFHRGGECWTSSQGLEAYCPGFDCETQGCVIEPMGITIQGSRVSVFGASCELNPRP